jgi:hypothetical protein
MILKRLPVDADLSSTSYEVATKGIDKPILRISVDLMKYAEKLRIPYEVDLRLFSNSWYIVGVNGGTFSVGVP